MPSTSLDLVSRKSFSEDRQGRTFADVLNDPEQPLDEVLAFFANHDRQRRMEETETHHDRPRLAAVAPELEGQPGIDRFLATQHPRRTKRLRQAVGVVVRMIMEGRGWEKAGKKGSLCVRAVRAPRRAARIITPAAWRSGSCEQSATDVPRGCLSARCMSGAMNPKGAGPAGQLARRPSRRSGGRRQCDCQQEREPNEKKTESR